MASTGQVVESINGYTVCELIEWNSDGSVRVVGFGVFDSGGNLIKECSTVEEAVDYLEEVSDRPRPGPSLGM